MCSCTDLAIGMTLLVVFSENETQRRRFGDEATAKGGDLALVWAGGTLTITAHVIDSR